MQLTYRPRAELADHEWENESARWQRPPLDPAVIRNLSERSTANGLLRVGYFVLLLAGAAALTMWAARISIWLAIPFLYAYYFLYGFWVAIGHELQHKMVFGRSANAFSEVVYFIVQTLMWNSPRYARISHRLHHRYTMVQGVDPETDWPPVITSRWLRRYFWNRLATIAFIGAFKDLWISVRMQVSRIAGVKDRMMRDHCKESDIRAIRIESAAILLFHTAIVAAAIWFQRWELFFFITIAWQVGWAIEGMWHQTEHIGRAYNVTDFRLCTRSVKVGSFIHSIYWGLDDHVDHHMFPSVPSRNLPRLHQRLKDQLPEPHSMFHCWREMFTIAREKDQHPDNEYVPCPI